MADEVVEEATSFGRGREDYKQADWLSEELGRKWRFDHAAQRWHHWNGVRWAPDLLGSIMFKVASLARNAITRGTWARGGRELGTDGTKVMLSLLGTASQKRALEALATFPEYATDGRDWDTDPYLLGCENGIVDLRDNALVPHPNPDMLVTKTTGHKFVPVYSMEDACARAPRFMRFMDEVTSRDPAMVDFLLQWFGYSLIGRNPEQKFLLMIGGGRNGKGKLKDAVLNAVGEYGSQANPNMYMRSQRHTSIQSSVPRADLMALRGTRIVFCSDPEGGQFNEQMLKAHTGEDRIKTRNLYDRDEVEWEPTHNLAFLVNYPPAVEDVGDSFRERVLVADFRESYLAGTSQPPDLELGATLAKEAEGILAILVWACYAWHAAHLVIPERVMLQSRAFVEANDPLAQFITDACVKDPEAWSRARALYDAYAEWFARSGHDGEPMNVMKFGFAMERKHFRKVRRESGYYYQGLRTLGAVELAARGDGSDEE